MPDTPLIGLAFIYLVIVCLGFKESPKIGFALIFWPIYIVMVLLSGGGGNERGGHWENTCDYEGRIDGTFWRDD